MGSEEFKLLKEAYLNVYKNIDQLDEISANLALSASKEASKKAGTLSALSGGDPKVIAQAKRKKDQAERLYAKQAKKRLTPKITKITLSKEEFESIISYLFDEGYAETVDEAQEIIEHMDEELIEDIIESYKSLPVSKIENKVEKLQNKFSNLLNKKKDILGASRIVDRTKKMVDVVKKYR